MPAAAVPGLTHALATFVAEFDGRDLPPAVQAEATRAFVNAVGGMLGGARHDAVERTFRTALPFSGGAQATVFGRRETLGALDAALVNCQASAAHAYDDTHLATVLHPAGPVLAPLLAEAERRPVSGADLLAAFAIGVEMSCRAASMIARPPAENYVGWYMTSVASPIGAAAGVARLIGLSAEQTAHALGIASAASAGFRQVLGSMCTSLLPGHASRAGYWAALLAAEGVTASETSLEGPRGFAEAFAPKAHPAHASEGLGARWDMLENMAKPYPCGIVIHPILDACLAIAATPGFDAATVQAVEVQVNPLCLTLTDRPAPPDSQRAQISLQHWSAAALIRGAAGIPEGSEASVADPDIRALAARVEPRPDPTIATDSAHVAVVLADGTRLARRIDHALGSLERPMTDAEIDAKFLGQAALTLPQPDAAAILALCRRIADLPDAAAVARAINAAVG